MSKQQKLQQYIFKINSTLLAKNNWDLTLPLNKARRVSGLVVSLADSQVLTWINELNGTSNLDAIAKEIKKEIKLLKRQPSSSSNKKTIRDLYSRLYKLQFKEDYVCVIMDKKSHYDKCNKGFKINGVPYKRLMCTVNGVKTSTVVYVSERIHDELYRRIINGRNLNIPLVPAKVGAYESLTASASVPVSWPNGVIVVPDCIVKFKSDLINIDDSDLTKEPIVEFAKDQEVVNNCSDGCGMMLPSLSMRWSGELNNEPDRVISGCNLRNSYTKGMVFTFDFIKFAEEVAHTYIIKDVWGIERDVREAELILTDGQLKLWKCYDSWEDYYEKCIENKYTFRVSKTAPYIEEMDDIRQLNYQFIQPLELSDDDVMDLVSPTTNEIKDIIGLDYRKSIVYLCGKGLDEKTIQYAEPVAKALMIEPNMINDSYLRNRIRKMIDRRIKDAKIGVLDVCGNFQILSGDIYALCESMFGMEVHGVLKAGEIYSKFWRNKNVARVLCARAPMSNKHSLLSQNICYDASSEEWFKYMDSVVVVNAWDTMSAALNGFDYDGDLLFTTNNDVMLKNQTNLPALNCIQYNAKKCIVDEDAVIDSNKKGFGSKIGAITNRITEMTALMANFDHDSDEYKMLEYRTQCGQAQQQAEIDAAKGIISNPMPKSWYVWKDNCIEDGDSDDVVQKKLLYQRICAHKKPYFFQYNYAYLHSDYMKYKNQANENAKSLFHKTVDEMLKSSDLTSDEQTFINIYNNKLPLDSSPSTMNKICWYVEDEFSDFNHAKELDFDYEVLKSHVGYSAQEYSSIKKLCKDYKNDSQRLIKRTLSEESQECDEMDDANRLLECLNQLIDEQVPNIDTQCDILVDLCYKGGFNRQIVWFVCGDIIVENLLRRSNGIITYPQKSQYGDFSCCGSSFTMKSLKIIGRGGEYEDEEF